jgi:uridine kinase
VVGVTCDERAQVVAARLRGRGAGLVLACIDGFMASGKSTLAKSVAASVPGDATLIHADELYGPERQDWRSWSPREGYERYLDHRRLETDVLRELRRGKVATYQRFDWTRRVDDGWLTVSPTGVVLVEGVYLLRRRLRRYWDLAVFVDTPREIRRTRAYERGETDEGWIAMWMRAEDYYARVDDPAGSADLVVPGD